MRCTAFNLLCPFFVLTLSVVSSPSAAWAQPKPKRTLGIGHTQAVVALAFSSEGTSLASASLDKTIILWDTRTAGALHTFEGHSRVPCAIAFSADGKTLVSCGRNSNQVELLRWSTATGKLLDKRILKVNNTLSVELPAFSRDGRRLTTITHNLGHPHVRVWDTATGDVVAEYETRASTKMATRPPSLSFSPDGKTIVSVESKSTVRLVNTTTDHDESFPNRLRVCRSAIFSPDGKTVAAVVSEYSSPRDETASVSILDIAEKKVKRAFPIGAGRTEVALSPDGTLLASIGQGVKVWDTKTGRLKASLLTGFQRTYGHQRLAFSPDGRHLAAPNGSRVEIWDVADFK